MVIGFYKKVVNYTAYIKKNCHPEDNPENKFEYLHSLFRFFFNPYLFVYIYPRDSFAECFRLCPARPAKRAAWPK